MTPRTKRDYLRQLVAGKNESFRPLTAEEKALGFLGWHQRGYLPHCDFPGLVQFVTFRLVDSMPASRRGEWEHLLDIEDNREKRTKLEEYLDRGIGLCQFCDPQVARLAEDALLHFDRERYELHGWCVMPNHVHALVHVWRTPLSKLVQSWKSYVAVRANQILRQRKRFWEPEYWDTFMRNEKREQTAIRYIENNPLKARLCRVVEEWPYSSAKFRDPKTRELALPSGAQSSSSARS